MTISLQSLTSHLADGGGTAVKASRRSLAAALLTAALLSACTEIGSTDDGQVPPISPTSAPTVVPVRTELEPGTSSPAPAPHRRPALRHERESANPVLRGVRFSRHDTFDRLAFDSVGRPTDSHGGGGRAARRGRVRQDRHPRGQVRLVPSRSRQPTHTPTPPTHGPQRRRHRGRTDVRQYRLISDFEGVVATVRVMRLEETATAVRPTPTIRATSSCTSISDPRAADHRYLTPRGRPPGGPRGPVTPQGCRW